VPGDIHDSRRGTVELQLLVSIVKGAELKISAPLVKQRVEHSPGKLLIWRPRRDLNPCYRRESGMAKRNSDKQQEPGWRSRRGKRHLIVSPMCPH
jgi:hypothetical protein